MDLTFVDQALEEIEVLTGDSANRRELRIYELTDDQWRRLQEAELQPA